jgi:hypothetical protein
MSKFTEYLEGSENSIVKKGNIKAINHLLDKIIVRVEEAGNGLQHETLSVVESINDILLEAIEKLEKLKK